MLDKPFPDRQTAGVMPIVVSMLSTPFDQQHIRVVYRIQFHMSLRRVDVFLSWGLHIFLEPTMTGPPLSSKLSSRDRMLGR